MIMFVCCYIDAFLAGAFYFADEYLVDEGTKDHEAECDSRMRRSITGKHVAVLYLDNVKERYAQAELIDDLVGILLVQLVLDQACLLLLELPRLYVDDVPQLGENIHLVLYTTQHKHAYFYFIRYVQ